MEPDSAAEGVDTSVAKEDTADTLPASAHTDRSSQDLQATTTADVDSQKLAARAGAGRAAGMHMTLWSQRHKRAIRRVEEENAGHAATIMMPSAEALLFLAEALFDYRPPHGMEEHEQVWNESAILNHA